MKPHGFYQKVSICIRMGMVRISVETTVVIYFTPTVCFVVVIKSLSRIWFFAIPWTAACQDSLSFTISWSLLKLMFIGLVMPSNHLFLCHPLLFLTSIFPSIRVFSSESALCTRWPKYWSFSFRLSPSKNIHSWFPLGLTGLISLLSKGLSRAFCSTTIWKSQFVSTHLLYGPTLTSVYDSWKNHSFDWMDLFRQSDVSAVEYTV